MAVRSSVKTPDADPFHLERPGRHFKQMLQGRQQIRDLEGFALRQSGQRRLLLQQSRRLLNPLVICLLPAPRYHE